MRISIIIPTLNEQDELPRCLQTLRDNAQYPDKLEIIVVDAGSQDKTLERVPVGITLIKDENLAGFKFKSLNAGAARASGEVLLFLDADTEVPSLFDKLIRSASSQPDTVGGAFEFSFDKKTWSLQFITLINRLRYRVRQSYYGDQAIFVNKETFHAMGGFPPVRLLEAAHMCQRLRKLGKLQLIKEPIVTSSRRFVEGGILRVFFFDLLVWLRNMLGLDVAQFADQYWTSSTRH